MWKNKERVGFLVFYISNYNANAYCAEIATANYLLPSGCTNAQSVIAIFY